MSEKKHPPTPTRLKELRKKGQQAQPSRALETTLQLAALAALYLLADTTFKEAMSLWKTGVDPSTGVDGLPALSAGLLVRPAALGCLLMAVGPVAALLLSRRASLTHIAPKPEAFNPASIFGRLFGKAQIWTHVFGLICAMASIAIYVVQVRRLIVGPISLDTVQGYSKGMLWSAVVMHFAVAASVPPMLKVVLSPVDMLAKHFIFLSQNKMSDQDLRDEHKNTEGNPEIKMAQRQIQMEEAA